MSHPPAPADVRTAIDGGAWSTFQKAILAVTALAVVMDGFDNQLIGFAVPAIMADWGLPKDRFGPVLAISLLCMTIGTFLGGLAGDRFGRRPALIGSMLVLTSGTGLASISQDLTQLALLRWAAALGLGGAMPNATALLAEYTPVAKRSVAVSLAIIGVPIGGVVAGLVAAGLLTSSGWRGLFMAGGLLSLATTALIVIWLPESPNHLLRFPEKHERLRRIMQRCGIVLPADAVAPEQRKGALFAFLSRPFLARSLVLWGAFFSSLFAVYLVFSWLPTLFAAAGFDLKVASGGLASFNFGSVVGAVAGGWSMDRTRDSRPLVVWGICGAIMALAMCLLGLAGQGATMVTVAMGVLGIFAGGSQVMLFAAAAHLYPAALRAGGVGAALAFGRLGGVTSSLVGPHILNAGPTAFFAVILLSMLSMTAFLIAGLRLARKAATAV
ncbi:MAG: MFS transporter [Rhodospirillaceae bacterium]|nr:MFS transporter [Rhodospirillaceae bacterium]